MQKTLFLHFFLVRFSNKINKFKRKFDLGFSIFHLITFLPILEFSEKIENIKINKKSKMVAFIQFLVTKSYFKMKYDMDKLITQNDFFGFKEGFQKNSARLN